ncbi:MAG: cupin domain-containing protein [Pseudomonadota bacterium]
MGESKTIGQRIRTYREKKGFDIQTLAEMAGCSDEFLGWIEEDQAVPPVSLLLRLAKALQLDSGTFLNVEDSPEKRLQEASKRTEHYSYQTLTSAEPDKHLMAFSIKIPPRTAHEGVGYQHEGEEFVYVLCGEVELTVGVDRRRLAAKESLRFNANLNHHLSNPGDEETELLVILYVP